MTPPAGEDGYCDLVQKRIREIAIANIENIAQALVQRASEGHYNAAHLLLDLAGLGPAKEAKSDTARTKLPGMFVLELADRVFRAEK
jgi:hypothetical protein